jgi:hypothetical protein
LLTVFSLRKKLEQAGYSAIRIFLPDVPAAQRKHFNLLLRFAIATYSLCLRIPGLRHLLFLIGPVFYSVSQQGESVNG